MRSCIPLRASDRVINFAPFLGRVTLFLFKLYESIFLEHTLFFSLTLYLLLSVVTLISSQCNEQKGHTKFLLSFRLVIWIYSTL